MMSMPDNWNRALQRMEQAVTGEAYTSPALETAPRRSLVELREELLAEQLTLTARHYAALLELQTVHDELAAVEGRLQALDAVVPS